MQFFTQEPNDRSCAVYVHNKLTSIRYSLMLFLFLACLPPAFAQQPACDVITSPVCSSTLTACVNQEIPYSASVVFYGGATYTWDFAANTSGASIVSGQGTLHPVVNVGSTAGYYILRLTMVNPWGTTSCTASLTVIQLTSTASYTPVGCTGCTSTLSVTAAGGIEPYTYTLTQGNISNGTGIFTGLLPGTYTVTVTNGPTGCSTTNTVVIAGTGAGTTALVTSETHTNDICGTGTGSIDLTVTGGTPPYTYVWTALAGGIVPSGQTNQENISGLVPGSYAVVVTDATGATAMNNINITGPSSAMAIASSHTNISCFGIPDGGIDITVTGGTPPYSYVWTASGGGAIPAGQGNATILTGLTAGAYSVVVTDANGCTKAATINITGPATGIIAQVTQTNVSCFGGSTGAIDLSVSGGTAPYSYIWTGANGGIVPAAQQNNQDISGIGAGTYNVVITDAANCSVVRTFEITQPGFISIGETHVNIGCNAAANSGSIDITVTGGTASYTYAWSAINGGIIPAGQVNSQDLSGLVAGAYTLIVTDANGCIRSKTVIIESQNGVITEETHVNVNCFGGSTGSINLSISGGITPYAFSWTATGGGVIPAGQVNAEDLTGLQAGSYSVAVSDATGCATTTTVIITQPASALSATTQSTNILCSGATGAINLTVSGGTAPYTYLWVASMGNGTVPPTQVANQDLTGLQAGSYTVIITDAHGCSLSKTVVISVIPSTVATSATQTNVNCFGAATGAINLTVSGGAAPYTYLWTSFAGGIVPPAQVNNQDLTGLVAGMYIVTVTDLNGCTSSRTLTITEPASGIGLTETHVNVSCFEGTNGSINLTVSGGLAPYSYTWTASNGGTIPAGQSATQDLSGLKAGTYIVIVTDANGCTRDKAVVISQPPHLVATGTKENEGCIPATGSINLTVAGGTPPYTYVWEASGGGAIPAGQINGQDISGLIPGVYHVTVTDMNGCIALYRTDILHVCGSPLPCDNFTTFATNTPAACSLVLGSINLTVSGGTAPYSYVWTATGGGIVPAGQANSQDLTGLVAGEYHVVVSDANSCATIRTVLIAHAPEIIATTTQINPGCTVTTGSINLTVSGGSAPYTYLWTATGGGIVPAGQATSQDLTAIVAGTYSVLITDANGCTRTKTVTITQGGNTAATYSVTNVSCYNGENGAIDLTVSGNTSGVAYTWVASAGGHVPSGQSHNQDLSGLEAGMYIVLITGSQCGNTTLAITVTQPAELSASLSQTNVLCGSVSGAVNLTVTGGTMPYTYSWTAGSGGVIPAGQASSQDLNGLVPGIYSVLITDAKGCTRTKTATISQSNSNIQISATPTNVLCAEGATGAINILVNGGNGLYTYAWTATNGGIIPAGQSDDQNLTGLVAGTYTVIVTDINGCTKTKSITLSQPQPLVTYVSVNNVTSCGGSNGSINLSVSGGNSPYTYVWTAAAGGVIPPGQADNQDLSGLKAGTYTVVITSATGCTATLTAPVTQNCGTGGNNNSYGCSYKYWRSHIGDWNQLNDYVVSQMPASLRFITTTNFYTYFNIPVGSGGLPNNLTMQSALNLHGGGCKNFTKYAVSALLTSASGQNITYPTGTNNFTSLYTVIRTALLNSNCGNPLKNQLKNIKPDCHDDGDDDDGDDDDNGGNNDDDDDDNDDDDDDDDRIGMASVTVNAFPNPFTDKIVFRINSNLSGDAVLELYGLMGEKIAQVYKGPVMRNLEKTVTFNTNPANRKTMIYKLKVGGVIQTGKIIYLN